MEEVKLYTADGGYVTTALVPKFNPKADVLVWGSRTFVLKGDTYVEGMTYWVTETK